MGVVFLDSGNENVQKLISAKIWKVGLKDAKSTLSKRRMILEKLPRPKNRIVKSEVVIERKVPRENEKVKTLIKSVTNIKEKSLRSIKCGPVLKITTKIKRAPWYLKIITCSFKSHLDKITYWSLKSTPTKNHLKIPTPTHSTSLFIRKIKNWISISLRKNHIKIPFFTCTVVIGFSNHKLDFYYSNRTTPPPLNRKEKHLNPKTKLHLRKFCAF